MRATTDSRSTSPGWMRGSALICVLMCCLGVGAVSPPVKVHDVLGSWKIVLIASSIRAEPPADTFRVEFSYSDEDHVLGATLYGLNTHSFWLSVDGERLVPACGGQRVCTSTLIGRGGRVNVLTGEPEPRSDLAIRQAEDEELLRRILLSPSSWSYSGKRLTIYSYSELVRIELER